MLLGMAGDASFSTGRVELSADDVLLAYSDGVIESRDGSDEEFGCERLEAHLRRRNRFHRPRCFPSLPRFRISLLPTR